MGIKNVIRRAGSRAADGIAKLSVLSPEQIQQLQTQRDQYLSQMPSPDDEAAQALTQRLLAASSIEIYNEYLQHIHEAYVPIAKDAEYETPFQPLHNIRFFRLTKWITDRDENSLEKLVNVYQVLSNETCNIALVFHRTCENTEVYLAVVNTKNADDNVDAENYRQRIVDAIRGNFPGSELSSQNGVGILPCLDNHLPYSVASVSNVPAEKSEKFISQTIEKLLDGIVPAQRGKEYTLVLLATPVQDVENRKLHLAELYSALAPYAAWQTSFTFNESSGATSMATFGVNAGVSAGVQRGQQAATTSSKGTTESDGQTESETTGSSEADSTGQTITDSTGSTSGNSTADTTSQSQSHSTGTSTAHTDSTNQSDAAGGSVGVGSATGPNVSANYTHTWGKSAADTSGTSVSDATTQGSSSTIGHSESQSVGHSTAETVGKAVTKSVGKTIARTLGKAVTKSVADTVGTYKGVNLGGNFGANFARSSNVTATIGMNDQISQSFTNYNIKHTLEVLEEQMKRLEQSTALGMWEFAAYILSEDQNIANNVAHSFLALTQGEQSYLSQTAVNLWRGDMGDSSRDAKEICGYLRELRHPLFGLNPSLAEANPEWNAYPSIVSPTTILSGKELAYSLNFPQKSVAGFPVMECTEFGRNVVSYQVADETEKLNIGCIYHMNHCENTPVALGKDSISSHVFVTGSTGSGKSNTVYQILNAAGKTGTTFLVIEPAKGEYKHVFGWRDDVAVYGTNPYLSPMLRIDPFSFPDEVHVFEHIDRLTEIFNVCWPMYAAMPAVLKNAIEEAYESCGWDLTRSKNRYGERIYPTFSDVAEHIKSIIDTSEYDVENKGAYKGALLTRLKSLTNGINGAVFASDELSAFELFDQNVIIDLSRVGSTETKAMIMGVVLLKLQEHRMTGAEGTNVSLRHLTVLEEAHHILRRTSTEQAQEHSNLLGKSVEMLANAIAEMRTFGEGFIIVDQSPGLMDMSVIRNTNTKIIMRLPDRGDRELVGGAANLNDNQILELAKLPCGVGAIYQNEWVQPILCKVEHLSAPETDYSFNPKDDVFRTVEKKQVEDSLLDCIMNREIFRQGDKAELMRLKHGIISSNLSPKVKADFMDYLSADPEKALQSLRKLVFDFLHAGSAIETAKDCNEISVWATTVVEQLQPSIKGYSSQQINLALALILYEQSYRDKEYREIFCKFTEVYQSKGGVIL